MAMTEKQKRFCEYYIASGNATEAAVKAGYSKKTAKETGHENLTKPHLKEYIDEKLDEMANDRIADATEVLERLTQIARREVKENQVVTLRSKQEKWIPDDKGTARKQTIETEEAKVVEMPAKLSDVNGALRMLGQRYALFTDKVDLQQGDIVIKVGEWDGDDEAED
ncbi:terminase small subunit [Enterococcus sp. DIV0800]|uniref:terminase small subunit n=1 Tax=unclassified Enterococcus TaxID=2608891 RepID=UPI003D2FBB5D